MENMGKFPYVSSGNSNSQRQLAMPTPVQLPTPVQPLGLKTSASFMDGIFPPCSWRYPTL